MNSVKVLKNLRHFVMALFPHTPSQSCNKYPIDLDPVSVLGSEYPGEYQRILKRARKKSDKRPIANRYPWQSRLAIRNLFEYAAENKHPICMLTGTGGDHHFIPEVIRSLKMALEEGCECRILVWQEDDAKTSQKLLNLRSEFNNLKIRFSGTSELGDELAHFQVSGNDAYRVEAAHSEIKDPDCVSDYEPSFPARIHFSDERGARRLINFFESLWSIA